MTERILSAWLWEPLNESPSEKEGKLPPEPEVSENTMIPSMKVPPKRKGNLMRRFLCWVKPPRPSMKVPPKRKGNKMILSAVRSAKVPQ